MQQKVRSACNEWACLQWKSMFLSTERRRAVGGEEGASWEGSSLEGVYKGGQISHVATDLRVLPTIVDLSTRSYIYTW